MPPEVNEKPVTWIKANGDCGIEGVDLTALPPKVYLALFRLLRYEHPEHFEPFWHLDGEDGSACWKEAGRSEP